MDDSRIQSKTAPFLFENGLVWTGPGLNLLVVSVSATVSAAIFGSFFCHDITNLKTANSEMFRVNTFVNFLFFSIGEKINKRVRRSICFPL